MRAGYEIAENPLPPLLKGGGAQRRGDSQEAVVKRTKPLAPLAKGGVARSAGGILRRYIWNLKTL